MRNIWLRLVDSVLRPAQPHLARCLRERKQHLADRALFTEQRSRAIADVVARIEDDRAGVFATGDGVVTSRMTRLENEWRRLSRPDPEAGLMDLWARIAPVSWIDEKRWRGGGVSEQLDLAVKLASDVDGVEAAESAIRALWIGSRIRWRALAGDSDCTTELLVEPLRAAHEALSGSDAQAVVIERAHELESEVCGALLARFSDRPLLAKSIAHAALVDFIWHAALRDRPNPVVQLRALWATGYVVSSVDASGVTLEVP